MVTVKRWTRLLALIALITLLLSIVIAPLFAAVLAISIALLIEQWRTDSPRRLLRAMSRSGRRQN